MHGGTNWIHWTIVQISPVDDEAVQARSIFVNIDAGPKGLVVLVKTYRCHPVSLAGRQKYDNFVCRSGWGGVGDWIRAGVESTERRQRCRMYLCRMARLLDSAACRGGSATP